MAVDLMRKQKTTLTATQYVVSPLMQTMDWADDAVFQVPETLAGAIGSCMMDPETSGIWDSYGLNGSQRFLGDIKPNKSNQIFPTSSQTCSLVYIG